MKSKRYLNFLLIFLFLLSSKLHAEETFLVKGIVIDPISRAIIPGATIRILNSNKGTYTSTSGKFRLPVPSGKQTLKISSIGYRSREIEISSETDSLVIELTPYPVIIKELNVVADIDALQIVKRAIERKKENLEKIKTLQGLLYTKMVIEFGGDAFEKDMHSSGSTVNINIGPKKAPIEYQMFLTETFSNVYYDQLKDIYTTEIIQRRQTANILPAQNLIALGTFINLYNNRVKLINAEIVSPLSDDTEDFYNFSLKDRILLDDRYIYVLEFEPTTTIYPTFKGRIKIVEGTYNLIEAEVKPANPDIVPLIDKLEIIQKFAEVEKGIWYPDLLEFIAKARVDVILGIMSVLADIKVTSIFNELIINKALPDSIYAKKIKGITVIEGADSMKSSFWENNSLRDISEREKQIYKTVDSLVALRDSISMNKSDINTDLINPIFEFDRVSSVTLGLNPILTYNNLSLQSGVKYSFGQDKFFGYSEIVLELIKHHPLSLILSGKIFSLPKIFDFTSYDYKLFNTLNAALLHRDNYDYYRSDGWQAGLQVKIFDLSISTEVSISNNFSLINSTNRSFFSNKEWRYNPEIIEGKYSNVFFNVDYKYNNIFDFHGFNLRYNAKVLLGKNSTLENDYQAFYSSFEIDVPTFKTGYEPMELNLLFQFGLSTKTTPLQYQFRLPSFLQFYSEYMSFYTIPAGYFGGTEFYSIYFKYNLTDLWWRAIGLPLYEGRGIDFIISASMFKSSSLSYAYYINTQNKIYTELGYGFSRIPTFISNIFFLSLDFRFGIGHLAKERFGWGVAVNLPF